MAWELLGSETRGEAKRHNRFWQDRDVDGCPTTNDYRNSGYDRGHMCPAAEQKWSAEAMDDCFVMANMCPQDHSLNSGAWNTLENKERNWAVRDSAIVIVAGPIYNADDIKTIGNGVLVPSAFFKVLLAPYVEKPRAIAFVFPNMSSPGSMQNYVMTVDDVEKLTGYDFFSSLPDDIENEVESKASFREWNQR
ncbi:nuclease [Muribaculaceae bacterium]|nr:nuclease [Muribaculaceae bacterium]